MISVSDARRRMLPNELIEVGTFLFLLTLVGLAALSPWMGLVGDDWWFFTHLEAGQFPSAQLQENPARPVIAFVWFLIWNVFKLHIGAYYILIFLVQWLSGFIFYVMLRRVFRWSLGSAVVAAALSILYPSDTARVYLSTLTTRIAMLLAISGTFLWLRAWITPNHSTRLQALGLLLMFLSLLTYETSFFLIALLPLILNVIRRRERHAWARHALPCYAMLIGYLVFRLGVAYVLTSREDAFYASIRLAPEWLLRQLLSAFSASIWKGWLFTIKVMWDMAPTRSFAVMILAMSSILVALLWLQRAEGGRSTEQRQGLRLMGGGIVIAVAATGPVIVSNFSLEHAVGTLDGRLLHAAALGHAIMIIGLCALPWRFPLGERTQILIRNTLYATVTATALIGSLGVQRLYAKAWSEQLNVLDGLQTQAQSFRHETVFLLLNVPSGAFDIRFYYPSTQLLRHFYDDPTLHALPTQRDFAPDEQVVAFGEERVFVLAELVRREVMDFPYEDTVAFEVSSEGDLVPVTHIGDKHLCQGSCSDLSFWIQHDWTPARKPITLRGLEEFKTVETPPNTIWRSWLLRAIAFNARYPLP